MASRILAEIRATIAWPGRTQKSSVPLIDFRKSLAGAVVHELVVCRHRGKGVSAAENSLVQRVIVQGRWWNIGARLICLHKSIAQLFHVVEFIIQQSQRIPVRVS